MKRLAVTLLFMSPVLSAQETPDGKKNGVSVRELPTLLAESMEAKDFQNSLTLKDALTAMQAVYRKKGKELPIQTDSLAFREENAEAPDVLETLVKVEQLPRCMTGAQLLRALLAHIPTQNGTYRIEPGIVRITTQEKAAPIALLSRKIEVNIMRRPLHLALEDLYGQTGVDVFLDPRVGIRARTLVSMRFANCVSLGTVLLLLSETSGLKMLVTDEVIIITTPAIAQPLIRLLPPACISTPRAGPFSGSGEIGGRRPAT
jgi:hypothetical protein